MLIRISKDCWIDINYITNVMIDGYDGVKVYIEDSEIPFSYKKDAADNMKRLLPLISKMKMYKTLDESMNVKRSNKLIEVIKEIINISEEINDKYE